MVDQQPPAPHEAVAERITARRTALQTRHVLAPVGAVCDGWGAVAVLGADGEYEAGSCQGCALCDVVRPPVRQADPFARLPVVDSDEVW